MPFIGAERIEITMREMRTIGTGRRITKRAVVAQRPSSLGVIALLRITPLSILRPIITRIAGNGMRAPATARVTTEIPAYPKDLRKANGNIISARRVTNTVRPE
ncbi:unannotated protein [freshwater metagenome]|uniref:Unannotated protein n=1 Tax=freshwater metagenome TaxID=449393 RepID=A0A6J7BRK3_9ZZZZ